MRKRKTISFLAEIISTNTWGRSSEKNLKWFDRHFTIQIKDQICLISSILASNRVIEWKLTLLFCLTFIETLDCEQFTACLLVRECTIRLKFVFLQLIRYWLGQFSELTLSLNFRDNILQKHLSDNIPRYPHCLTMAGLRLRAVDWCWVSSPLSPSPGSWPHNSQLLNSGTGDDYIIGRNLMGYFVLNTICTFGTCST